VVSNRKKLIIEKKMYGGLYTWASAEKTKRRGPNKKSN
jgi:hypothetical protein